MPFLKLDDFLNRKHLHKSVQKYESGQEVKVPHPYWNLDREGIEKLVVEISDAVKLVVKDFPEDDKELDQLYDAAVRLPQIDRSPAKKVALLGAQGAGKSLLINALFDYDGLSLTGAEGSACTSSVVKYLFYPGAQQKFCAEVKFLASAKMTAVIKEHAKAYYDFHDSYENPDDNAYQHPSGPDKEDLETKLKNTAEEFFEMLFGSKSDFLESWDARTYENGEFVSLSLLKYEDALRQIDACENIKHFVGSDQNDLNRKLRPYLSKFKDQLTFWPLVDNVCIRITHPLLQNRIELFDLPGSGDTNASRTRHAEEIRDSVDVLIILADTLRVTTDESFINRARGAILTHGLDNVKLIATKIDALTDNQLKQYTGSVYDEIKELVAKIEDEAQEAEENDDTERQNLLEKYKAYLARYMKCQKITERARDVSEMMTIKARAWPTSELPEFFHISAASYMDWIARDRIAFDKQPALSPVETGIPAIREFLYQLPAQQNFDDIETHIHIAIPTFIEKLKRAAKHSNRDAGFRNLADGFDQCVREAGILKLSEQAKILFSELSEDSIRHFDDDIDAYRTQVNTLVKDSWLQYTTWSFNKAIKASGTVPKGKINCNGLTDGCNWNLELSNILAPGFRQWEENYSHAVTRTCNGLAEGLKQLYEQSIKILEKPAANVLIVEKAKNRWRAYRHKLMVKAGTLLDQIVKLEKRTQVWATMETRQEDNLVSSITNKMFDYISKSEPPLKKSTSSKKTTNTTPSYTMSKIKHRKYELEREMLNDDHHFVDVAVDVFQRKFDDSVNKLLDEFFIDIGKLLENYSNWLRGQAPINYSITPLGAQIRKDVQELIPTLEQKSQELKIMFPDFHRKEADLEQKLTDIFRNINPGGGGRSKGRHDVSRGSKRSIQGTDSNAKRIKAEITS